MKRWPVVLALGALIAGAVLALIVWWPSDSPPSVPPPVALPALPTVTPQKVIERKVVVMREQVWAEVRSLDTVALATRARARVLSADEGECGDGDR